MSVPATTTPTAPAGKTSTVSKSTSKKGLAKTATSSPASSDAPAADTKSSSPTLAIAIPSAHALMSSADSNSPPLTSGSPNGISAAIVSGRRQKSSGKLKLPGNSEEEDGRDSSRGPETPTSANRSSLGASQSPRPMPVYQAAVTIDPSLTYIPQRVYIVSDVNWASTQPTTAGGAPTKAQELLAMSVGRLWNLTTFLLIAGEKLGMPAQSVFIKSKMARVKAINDLREDDELIVSSSVEGPLALLREREQSSTAFVRLSPRGRIASSADPKALGSPTDASTPSGPAAGVIPPLLGRGRTASSASSVPDRSKTSPGSDSPGRQGSSPDLVPSKAKKGSTDSGSKSASPSKPGTPLRKTGSAGSGTKLVMSTSSDSMERSGTPSKSRTGKDRPKRTKQPSNDSDNLSAREIIEEDSKLPVFSVPIAANMPFEGRRLVRRDTTSFLSDINNHEVKVTALSAIKEHDTSISISMDHPVVVRHGDTGAERHSYSVESLYLELKRSRSTPDVWLYGRTRPLANYGAISTNVFLRDTSESTSSTFRDADDDFSDDDSSSLTSSSNVDFDLRDEHDKDFNPLTMPEEEIIKRMLKEEKQDVENLQVSGNEVQAGTLRALIRRLFWHFQNDDFLDQFLLTYDHFISHYSLLRTMIMLFRVPIAGETAGNVLKSGGVGKDTITPGSGRLASRKAIPGQKSDASSTGSIGNRSARGGDSPVKDLNLNLSRQSMSDLSTSESESLGRDSPRSDSVSGSPSSMGSNTAGMKFIIQFRILNMIKLWIEWRYETLSLKSNKKFFLLFNEFCEYLSNSNIEKHKAYASTLLQAVKSAKWNRLMLKRNLEITKLPKTGKSGQAPSTTKLTDWNAKEWAIYFTLREQTCYGKIKLKEYRQANFGAKDKDKKSPHLMKLINHFNKISYWVATAILKCTGFSEANSKARATLINHFIRVMAELKAMQNFSSMMEIFSALHMSAISRIEKTWSHVGSEEKKIVAEITKLIESNYKAYREMLDLVEPPCIPIQEVQMRDLTFIEENPTVLDNGWINFTKINMLGKAYKTMKRFQATPYDLKYPTGIHSCFKLTPGLSEEAIFDLSRVVEPSVNDLERIARAETEKKDAEKKEKKYRELISKYTKKAPTKIDLQEFFPASITLEALAVNPESAAAFYVHLQTVCEHSSLDYYRMWLNEWKGQKNVDKMKEIGLRIYELYLSASSENAISLNSQGSRQNVFKAVKGLTPITPELFDPINKEVLSRLGPLLDTYKATFPSA